MDLPPPAIIMPLIQEYLKVKFLPREQRLLALRIEISQNQKLKTHFCGKILFLFGSGLSRLDTSSVSHLTSHIFIHISKIQLDLPAQL